MITFRIYVYKIIFTVPCPQEQIVQSFREVSLNARILFLVFAVKYYIGPGRQNFSRSVVAQ